MTVDAKRLTLDEIALLREIARWRRNNGINFFLTRRATGLVTVPGALDWSEPRSRKGSKAVSFILGPDAQLGMTAEYRRQSYYWLEVADVTQAVDVLVAMGYLPARFSSAYRAGWDASTTWHDAGADEERFRRLFHDPRNPSFPAVEAAW